MIPKLKEHFTVISYDLRGHGKSPIPLNEFDLEDLVLDLENLRDRLDFKKAIFVGHSLGGMIAPAYALKYPDHVKALGLLSTAAGRTKEDSEKVWNVVHAMEKGGIEKTLITLTNRWFTDDFIKNNSDLVQQRLKQVVNTDPKVFLNVFRIYAKTEMTSWLEKITAPSLILTGELDSGCNPRLNRLIAKKLTNSKLVILDNLKHSILIEAPERVAEQVKKFILNYL